MAMCSLLCRKFGCWGCLLGPSFPLRGPGVQCLALTTECFGIGRCRGCPLPAQRVWADFGGWSMGICLSYVSSCLYIHHMASRIILYALP